MINAEFTNIKRWNGMIPKKAVLYGWWCKMTFERAFELLNPDTIDDMDYTEKEAKEAMRIGMKAVGKQMAKQPKRENGNWNCPICGFPAIRINYQPKKYCDECGQAFDWSKEEL